MPRTYDEDEAKAILAGAAEEASEAEDSGVTLAQLEAAAQEVGVDAALVRNAARNLDRAEERPRGEGKYGASVQLVARARVEGSAGVDALANRLFAEMADRVGEPGVQQQVGDARVWKTALFGRGLDAGQGQSQSLMVRPMDGGAELVLREDLDREASVGVALRAVAGAATGALLTFIVGDALGPVDDAIAFAVLTSPVYGALGWLAGKRWWRRRREQLAQAHTERLRALTSQAAALCAAPEPGDGPSPADE